MRLYLTSVSMIAALAVSGGATLAQSDGGETFCDTGYVRADTNSDGVIDKDELAKVTEAEFSSLDANDDGTVTMAEYSDCRGDAWTQLASNTKMMSDADVSAMDTNKDGQIDQSEYMDKADQEYTARWSETGTEREVRDAEFAPASGTDGAGKDVGSEVEGGMATDQADDEQAAASDQSSGQKTDEQAAASDQATDAQAGADMQAEPKMILRRIIFIPDNSPRTIHDMGRDEVAHRAAHMFLLLDTDRNKVIDPQEQKGESAAQADMEGMLNEQFQRADADKSGDLSREEYAADMEARWQRAQERQQNANPDVGAPVVYYRYPHPM